MANDKKTLHLVLKKQYFDEILSGKKKNEIREIRPKNASRYIEYKEDKDGEYVQAVKYDFIKFYLGYSKNRPEMLVECLGVDNIVLTDDEDNDLTYVEDGETYVRAINEYKLGKIISKANII